MMTDYEKWLWIELIGFDNQKDDFGVKLFIDKMGFTPNGISLLLWNSNFIHSHLGLREDDLLGETQCSYGARPYNEERARQPWTKFQLRGLVETLRNNGIEVYLSIFDQIITNAWREQWSIPVRDEWIDGHKELLYIQKDGSTIPSICPFKRLADGTFYEDFFTKKLCQVLAEYGFDGFHGADGYAHPRIPIYCGDFSDDMIDQFCESKDVAVPLGTTKEKAEWILDNAGNDWNDFQAKRQQQFWKKVIEALRVINCKLIFNTAWTRDPFEAKYRYGVDYRMLADIGVEKFIVEAPAAVVELEDWNKTPYNTLNKFMSMIMRIKAYVPDCKLILLNCIKDGMEQYNVLRHAPALLESDVFSMANVYKSDLAEKMDKCLSGVMACLADGISKQEWHTIRKTWDIGFSSRAKAFSGTTVIWSDKAFANEYESYGGSKLCNSYQMHYKLLSCGAPLVNICAAEALESISGCLVVIHPAFFPENDLHGILAYRKGPVIFVGMERNHDFNCTVHERGKVIHEFSVASRSMSNGGEPYSWLDELPAKEPNNSFFEETARIITQYSKTAALFDNNPQIKLWEIKTGAFTKRIFIRNDSPHYASTIIDVRNNIKTVDFVTDRPALPVFTKDNTLKIKMHPNAFIILDIITGGDRLGARVVKTATSC